MAREDIDIQFSKLALDLAAKGIGLVSPNPLVGCVIVAPDGQVVGEGTYIHDDITHAEGVALAQAAQRAKGGTAYVSLEPHHHQGRTPPCTEALINAGVARVVCPIEDPNPLVSGRGFERLRAAGLEVVTGILADEAARQNEKFICWHKKGRPFVHLKLAMSLDGRISLGRSVSTALSGAAALDRVHALRHEHDAILVGGNTVAVDDPSLTDRSGKARRRPLVRVVLDNRLQIPNDSRLVTTAAETPTVVFTNSSDNEKKGVLRNSAVDVIDTEKGDLTAVLDALKQRNIQGVLVEGGAAAAASFCEARLVDKATFIISPLIIGGDDAPSAIAGTGAASLADALKFTDVTVTQHGADVELTGYPES
jgi:diaminohydroxyphosphoribosylaminopyrimidine deaminase/5-amino-6-(5-phosphoribosylamino)uracil reductase